MIYEAGSVFCWNAVAKCLNLNYGMTECLTTPQHDGQTGQ